jgi:hypothetical protein
MKSYAYPNNLLLSNTASANKHLVLWEFLTVWGIIEIIYVIRIQLSHFYVFFNQKNHEVSYYLCFKIRQKLSKCDFYDKNNILCI